MRKVFVGTVSSTETLLKSKQTVFYAIYLQSLNTNMNHLGENHVSLQCTVKTINKDNRETVKAEDVINGGNFMMGQSNSNGIETKFQSTTFNIPLKEIPACDFTGQSFKNADEQETFKNDHYLLSYLNKEVLLDQKKWEELK